MLFFLFVTLVLSYPSPVQVDEPVEVKENLTKEFIIYNHMKYTQHDNLYTLPFFVEMTTYHERALVTIPLFSYKFKGVIYESINIQTINNECSIQDLFQHQGVKDKIGNKTKHLIELHNEADQLPTPSKLYKLLESHIQSFDGIKFDASFNHNDVLNILQFMKTKHPNYILCVVVKVNTDISVINRLKEYADYLFIDTSCYQPTATKYHPLAPLGWIEEMTNKLLYNEKEL